MNIFILDENLQQNAEFYVDKWIVKMPLETAQILCTVQNEYGDGKAPYKSTHKKHGCVIWASKSKDNFLYLQKLGLCLCGEYTFRYGKIHKCQSIIENVNCPSLPEIGLTPFYLAMPDKYKTNNHVESYRAYCNGEKQHIQQRWTKRKRPIWWNVPLVLDKE